MYLQLSRTGKIFDKGLQDELNGYYLGYLVGISVDNHRKKQQIFPLKVMQFIY